jgi:hypothetical protein
MKRSFTSHAALEGAMRNGFDFTSEQQLSDWVTSQSDEFKKSVVWSLGDSSISVTEEDLCLASGGNYTEGFKAFFTQVLANMEKAKEDGAKITDDSVVLQSMHSGSSDYLFLKDLREAVESWNA